MNKKHLHFIFTINALIFLTSCDYYYTIKEYKDNDLLYYIDYIDGDVNKSRTPIVFELEERCFIKKNNTWVLLNSKSKQKIKVMNNEKLPCITESEIQWANRICKSIQEKDIKQMRKILCNQ